MVILGEYDSFATVSLQEKEKPSETEDFQKIQSGISVDR